MVLCAKVKRKKAESVRQQLIRQGLFDGSYIPLRDESYVYFAVKGRGKAKGLLFVEKRLQKREQHGRSLEEELAGKLNKKELGELVKSFDIVGDIAVVEIPPSLAKKQKLIASAIMKNHHNIKTVAKKTGATSGEFRIRPVRVIAGEKKTSTVYRESGCEFELDLNKTYFSSRLSSERTRICSMVKAGENVLVPFAGVGPFAIRIAKAQPKATVIGIELNPAAARYFEKNIARNRCPNILALKGDVKKLLPGKYAGWADRVAMPLPKDSAHFLSNAIPCLKRGGTLHYYSFGDAKSPFAKAESEIRAAATRLGRKASVIYKRIVRPYSAGTVQVVIDAKIS
ncbi:MAG: class I SAM-dependent methyltransferase family protein [Candidatus Micrarchaeota archaeon]|nr:class I SAM-dependent methyltransferase family protein [Candidatus Micrarchaeota archaeon]